MSVRVLIADDHPVLRAGLISLLASEADFEIVGEAENGPQCVEMAVKLAPDVILMDINMPGGSGLEALEEIGRQAPEAKVLVLTMHDDIGYLKRVLGVGGAGYILKQAASAQLISAVRTVANGGVFMHPHHTRSLRSEEQVPPGDPEAKSPLADRYQSLSPREIEVFRLISIGHTNAEIAELSSLSVKTVETYKSRLSHKLGLSTRASLVRAAIELGVLS